MNSIYLTGSSLLTPLGADSMTVNTALEAGMSAYQFCNVLGEDEPEIQFAPVPAEALKVPVPARLPGLSPPQIRWLKLATFALLDIGPQLPEAPVPLFLAGPETYYQPAMVTPGLIQHLIKASGVNIDSRSSRVITTGRAGVIDAIEMAFKYFDATGEPFALVGGADTFYNLRTLDILTTQKRLAGTGLDGFVPGEGAGFLLLASPFAPKAVLDRSLLQLYRPAIFHERGHLLGNAAYTAETLASACTAAIANAQAGTTVDTLFSSENGELHYNKELTVATLRNQHRLSHNRKIVRPSEFLGDSGAAFGAIAVGLASAASASTEAHHSLICASSDGGPRGALVVSSTLT